MKAIVYSARRNEKDILMKANAGKHELTWHTAPLSDETTRNAAGHQAVIVFVNDEVSCSVIAKLAAVGIKYILTRSAGTDHIDYQAASRHQIEVKNVSEYSPYAVAEHAVALSLALSRHLIEASRNCKVYDFSLNRLTGFNLHGKTVGIIGLGNIGKVAGKIFHGFGCKVIGYDTDPAAGDPEIKGVDLAELLKKSDIISLHAPLNDATFHMINSESINGMKDGVMLINTARGALVSTADILTGLDSGKIGYYGADVYEFEKGLFFEDHETDQVRDDLLTRLMDHPNVLITPHQAFLTIEALVDIAAKTIQRLDEGEHQLSRLKVKPLNQVL
ncbi:2-hydroxyacid dehydrogenase [Pedobacter ginsengisoli]|uniref:2-hydroxyacid dehydrogenase n=1 Tax=Pedobacter ginsengisoli TaxID=363852 RepID=UPI00254B7C47|nr:2-hydroxyacid dehydrogenase [Pedobacter ginsengisoli]